MIVEIDLDDNIVEKFKSSYNKDLINNNDLKCYMKSVDELVHECIVAFMRTDLVMSNGGVLLEVNNKCK